MSTPTYEKIQHIELTQAAATLPFTSIPQTFTDLMLVISPRSAASSSAQTARIKFNTSDANFTVRRLLGTGSSTQSNAGSYGNEIALINSNTSTSNTFSSIAIYIPNYTSGNNKSFSIDTVSEDNATTAYQAIYAGIWAQTAAISGIEIYNDGGNFVSGSSATLYGIKSIPSAPKATGGIISYVNGYWVHTFTSSGTFTPTQNLSNVEYLVVAGGGGGGGGGGGAGGYRSSVVGELSGGNSTAESRLSLTSGTNYTVTIGAGGAGSAGNAGTSGANSVFGSITSIGGGGAGGNNAYNASSGGSGGGGGRSSNQPLPLPGGAGTTGQGFAGGDTTTQGGNFPASGGGGASQRGQDSIVGKSGNGGNGLASSITGVSITRAGGGGGAPPTNDDITGGSGGSGGGGNGSNILAGSGVPGTGSGGGGAGGFAVVGNGGSGIVVVRYQ